MAETVAEAFERGNQLAAAGQFEEAIAAFDRCLAHNADDWQALANRGNARMKLKRYHLALDDYLRAAALNPASGSVKCNLAVLLKELGELTLAENLLRELLAAQPDHVDAWSNLGVVLQYALRYDESAACQRRAIELGGPSPGRYNNLANALSCALRLDEAEAAYRAGLELAPDDADLRFNLSIALLLQGRYLDAWPLYEARWSSVLVPRYRERRWQGEPLGGRTLLLWAEQGLGDTLQMARFLPVLRQQQPDARLVLAVPRTFLRLFGQFDRVELIDLDAAAPPHDVQIPLMSLPGVLGVELETLPTATYLQALPARREDRLGHSAASRQEPLRVGVVWETGSWGVGIADHGRQNKSVPLEQFSCLFDMPGVDFISLQLDELPAGLEGRVRALPITDFADTAEVIDQLDLVLSVDTSVVHLAGAMGKPVWVLMRAESAPFFMAGGESSPWYPSMRILRQRHPGDWSEVIARAGQELAALGSAKHAATG
ncbi:Tetratricopeptide TPR_2 repeat protein [Pseudogulbenkiania ferrooxidans 2002]|uniref:Tetratricopeptide TPR_2 repeat protein n=2 Tax=Pseudogulbenkiania ferrooxidans TaxID=549169 RepID=B9Z897_9NEIS|nr:Tetratricopeptide TPR_2 repeat protein [Pseudogulbenkiania ferrooxidans 2002]